MIYTPYIVSEGKGFNGDIWSRMLKDRIVMLFGEIDDTAAGIVIPQLMYLDSIDKSDIQLYINSPGGSVTAGFAIYDAMRCLKCDVATVAIGQASSMGAFLLAAGTKGKRYALKNASIMIHQPLGGASGQASDIQIQAENIKRCKEHIEKLLAEFTGQNEDAIRRATDRDNFMTAGEAVKFGIADWVK